MQEWSYAPKSTPEAGVRVRQLLCLSSLMKGLIATTNVCIAQGKSFSSASATGLDEAGFWPVTSLPSVMTKGTQFATFS